MAGHSEYSNIKRKKEAQDSKRGKIFTKLSRLIEVAARSGGPDVEGNPSLRSAVEQAKQHNMPKSKIDYAIQKATTPKKGHDYAEVRYECRTEYGMAMVVTALTDNRNRTASQIRTILARHRGVVSSGLAYLFDNLGLLRYRSIDDKDSFFEEAIAQEGVDDITVENNDVCLYTDVSSLNRVLATLKERYGFPREQRLVWRAKEWVTLGDEDQKSAQALIELLEQDDDVQCVDVNLKL